jgi:hypothetical protein
MVGVTYRGSFRRSPRRAALAAALCLIPLLALLAPQRAQAVDCETAICIAMKRTTNSKGEASLVVPPDAVGQLPWGLDGCTWQVKVQFGDGSPSEEIEFKEESGLVASHTFPEPGVYLMTVDAIEGVRSDLSECPDVHIDVTVTYPEPPPPKEEPGPEEPGTEPPLASPGSAGSAGSPMSSVTPPSSAGSQNAPYWRDCGGGIRAHRVPCRKARRVIRAARSFLSRARLEQGASFRVEGFSCRLRRGSLSCRHGSRRVLGA